MTFQEIFIDAFLQQGLPVRRKIWPTDIILTKDASAGRQLVYAISIDTWWLTPTYRWFPTLADFIADDWVLA